MTRIRKSKNLRPVTVRKLAAKKNGPGADSGATNEKPHALKRILEFPKQPALDDIVSERIIFEVGNTRFAINWTAEIEQLRQPVRSRSNGRGRIRTVHLR